MRRRQGGGRDVQRMNLEKPKPPPGRSYPLQSSMPCWVQRASVLAAVVRLSRSARTASATVMTSPTLATSCASCWRPARPPVHETRSSSSFGRTVVVVKQLITWPVPGCSLGSLRPKGEWRLPQRIQTWRGHQYDSLGDNPRINLSNMARLSRGTLHGPSPQPIRVEWIVERCERALLPARGSPACRQPRPCRRTATVARTPGTVATSNQPPEPDSVSTPYP
jgi:hypothetical protein